MQKCWNVLSLVSLAPLGEVWRAQKPSMSAGCRLLWRDAQQCRIYRRRRRRRKKNSQFKFCKKIHFAKRPTTFHQRARWLLMAKVTFSNYLPARFFNQMMPSRIFFTLKTPRGSGELWFMCIHYTGEQRLYECDEHTKRSHGRSMFHIKSH